jgi:predicted outer membrane repeat protein
MFSNNIAQDGGAVYVWRESVYSNSSNCTFYNNSAAIYGGALYLDT